MFCMCLFFSVLCIVDKLHRLELPLVILKLVKRWNIIMWWYSLAKAAGCMHVAMYVVVWLVLMTFTEFQCSICWHDYTSTGFYWVFNKLSWGQSQNVGVLTISTMESILHSWYTFYMYLLKLSSLCYSISVPGILLCVHPCTCMYLTATCTLNLYALFSFM